MIRPLRTDFRASVHPSTRPHFHVSNSPSSESVHEVDGLIGSIFVCRPPPSNGLSPNFGPLSTWTDGRVDGQQRLYYDNGLLWVMDI